MSKNGRKLLDMHVLNRIILAFLEPFLFLSGKNYCYSEFFLSFLERGYNAGMALMLHLYEKLSVDAKTTTTTNLKHKTKHPHFYRYIPCVTQRIASA